MYCWLNAFTAKYTIVRMVAGLLCAFVTVSSVGAEEAEVGAWKIAAPWRSPGKLGTPELFAQALTKELQVLVEVEAAVEGTMDGALAWSLANARTQPSLVLLSDELVQVSDRNDPDSPRNLSLYDPLILVWLTRWCLFTKDGTKAEDPKALMQSLRTQRASPHIAIPEIGGRMSVWVRGMEQRTKRKWVVSTYGLRGSVADALERGADVALGYCSRQMKHPNQTRILVQSGNVPAATMPDVPLSAASGWMPMDHGWVAWAAPKSIELAQREKMAAALYRVMGTVEVQARLDGVGHVFEHWTPQQSREHVEAFTRTWEAVSDLLHQGELFETASP